MECSSSTLAQMLISANVLQASRPDVEDAASVTVYGNKCCHHACQDVKTSKDISTTQSSVGDDASRGHAASAGASRLLRANGS